MSEFVTDWANLLPALVPWERLAELFPPTRVDRRSRRKLNTFIATGSSIFPGSLDGFSSNGPLTGYIRVQKTAVEFALDQALRVRRTLIEPNGQFGVGVSWGNITGRAVWSPHCLMKFEWHQDRVHQEVLPMLQIPPVWALVLAKGLADVGFDVAGHGPLTQSADVPGN